MEVSGLLGSAVHTNRNKARECAVRPRGQDAVVVHDGMTPARQRNGAPHAEARTRVNSDLRHVKVYWSRARTRPCRHWGSVNHQHGQGSHRVIGEARIVTLRLRLTFGSLRGCAYCVPYRRDGQ
jgi:hypothetical protein